LNEFLLAKDEGAVQFLRKHLALRKGDFYKKTVFREHPEIWLVTGLHFSSETKASEEVSLLYKLYANIEVPLPSPATATSGGPSFGGGAEGKHVEVSKYKSTFPGERIWAARYAKLNVKYVIQKKGREVTLPNHIPLYLHEDDKRNIRGDDVENEEEAEEDDEEYIEQDEREEEGEEEECAVISLDEGDN
jgi:hypothetical protein